jgi:ceramide glucosyltransferase
MTARMMIPILAAEAFCIATTAVHVASTLVAIVRCKSPAVHRPAPADAPAVSLVRPVCGVENHIEETLASAFRLDYPRYEIVFCVAFAHDPVVPTVRRLMTAHPGVPARLLVGNEKISDNPKLNNVYKGWRDTAQDWSVLADSNVFMPPPPKVI